MEMNRTEILKRLMQIDSDMALIDTTPDIYTCIIVGGSALVLMQKIHRSTHDIDSINASNEIKPLLESYNINMNVRAHCTNFPESYLDRIVIVDIPTTKVKFYTVSLEDLVVSKLCAMRNKDIEDIETQAVYSDLNWNLLDNLVEEVCYGMLSDYDVTTPKEHYKNYKEKYKCEN